MTACQVDAMASLAEAETRSRPSLAVMAGGARMPVVGAGVPRRIRGARWTPAEDAFLRAQLGYLSEAAIGRTLGRSRVAVSNRWKRDLHLISPRRNPKWLTLEALARGLGMDQKSVAKLVDRGEIDARLLPARTVSRRHRPIRVVDRHEALAWIADPMHWVYFRPERVGAFHPQGQRRTKKPDVVFWRQARTAVETRRRTWRDAWLSPGQAAKLFGVCSSGAVNKAILLRLLPAIRWGNWWILQSEALKFARERITGGKIKRIHFKCPVAPERRGGKEVRRDKPVRQAGPA